MSRLNTFYLPTKDWPEELGGKAVLDGSEGMHLIKVLRAKPGETIRLIDGYGREGLFDILSMSKREAVLEARELALHERPEGGVCIALGWNRSKRRDFLMEKAVELGAASIVFWQADRSQGKVPEESKDAWFDKLIQAAKQCGCVHLPEVAVISGGISGLVAFAESVPNRFLAWESADSASTLLTPEQLAGKSVVVIGPEGGITEGEADALVKSGFAAVTLGNSILRWETAAFHCLSMGFLAAQRR